MKEFWEKTLRERCFAGGPKHRPNWFPPVSGVAVTKYQPVLGLRQDLVPTLVGLKEGLLSLNCERILDNGPSSFSSPLVSTPRLKGLLSCSTDTVPTNVLTPHEELHGTPTFSRLKQKQEPLGLIGTVCRFGYVSIGSSAAL